MCQWKNLLRDKFGVKFSPAGLSDDELLAKFQSVALNVKWLIENPYMLFWRVINNIDALRDIYINGENLYVEATAKDELEGYTRG